MQSERNKAGMNRRTVLKSTLAAGAYLGVVTAAGAETISFKRTGPNDLIKIGALSCGDGTHTRGLWAPLINGVGKTRTTGMVITHCWDVLEDQKEEFAKNFGCTPVKHFDDMLGKVDGILNGDYYAIMCNHKLNQLHNQLRSSRELWRQVL